MTIAKAKLYRTAQLNTTIYDDYRDGDYVAVEFIGRGSFGLNFRISKQNAVSSIVVGDSCLDNFVL